MKEIDFGVFQEVGSNLVFGKVINLSELELQNNSSHLLGTNDVPEMVSGSLHTSFLTLTSFQAYLPSENVCVRIRNNELRAHISLLQFRRDINQ